MFMRGRTARFRVRRADDLDGGRRPRRSSFLRMFTVADVVPSSAQVTGMPFSHRFHHACAPDHRIRNPYPIKPPVETHTPPHALVAFRLRRLLLAHLVRLAPRPQTTWSWAAPPTSRGILTPTFSPDEPMTSRSFRVRRADDLDAGDAEGAVVS